MKLIRKALKKYQKAFFFCTNLLRFKNYIFLNLSYFYKKKMKWYPPTVPNEKMTVIRVYIM